MSLGSFSQIFREGVLTKLENKEFSRVPLVCKAWATHSEQLPVLMARYRDPSLTHEQQSILLKKILIKIQDSGNYLDGLANALYYTQQYLDVLFSVSLPIPETLCYSDLPIEILRQFIFTGNEPASNFIVLPPEYAEALDQLSTLMPKLQQLSNLSERVSVEALALQLKYPFLFAWVVSHASIVQQYFNYATILETHYFNPFREFVTCEQPEKMMQEFIFQTEARKSHISGEISGTLKEFQLNFTNALGLLSEKVDSQNVTHPDLAVLMILRGKRIKPTCEISLHSMLQDAQVICNTMLHRNGVKNLTRLHETYMLNGLNRPSEIKEIQAYADELVQACIPLEPKSEPEPAAKKSKTL